MAYIDDKKVKNLRWLRQNRNVKICTTNGCFDLLHPGHVHFFIECSKIMTKRFKGEKTMLVVLVNDDDYVRNKTAGRPIMYEGDRLMMVQALKQVSAAWLFSENNPTEWIKKIEPDAHFKGDDWKDKHVPEAEFAPVDFIPLSKGISTTILIEHIMGTQEALRG